MNALTYRHAYTQTRATHCSGSCLVPAVFSNLSHLSWPGADPLFPVPYCISKSPQFVPWNDLQNYFTYCKQLRFANLQCLTKQGTGDRSVPSWTQTRMKEKTGISELVKMLGFHAKALKSPHLPTLRATSACDPAVCGSFWLSQQAVNFNITASSTKLRETQDSSLFSL